jgi:hypothetical protein
MKRDQPIVKKNIDDLTMPIASVALPMLSQML